MKILVFDNYDSFTYNLVQLLRELSDALIDVVRNDKIDLKDVEQYDKIVLSPGPGIPADAGMLEELIRVYAPTKSILGVCLGHQAICEVFGAKLENLTDVHHGVAEKIFITKPDILFTGLPDEIEVGRYHSWIVSKSGFPDCMEITSVDATGEIMSARHKQFDVRGVQFHPESVLTPEGSKMISNWLNDK